MMSEQDIDKINALKQSIIATARDIDPEASDFDADEALDSVDDVRSDANAIAEILGEK